MGNTPLHVACYNGQEVVIEGLIYHGANVNAANSKGLVSIASKSIAIYSASYK